MARTSLPPGFRFHPTDIELIMYYLKRKVMGKKLHFEAISELNLYKFSPSDLPDKSCLKSKDREWFFFCPRERKYASGARMNRSTKTGYWKTTGKDRVVVYSDRVVGMVKTLVFHEGNAPRGKRTDWVIYEYRLDDKSLAETGVSQDAYVLCKVFHKNGRGPKNGAQYGAPFIEEEWDVDFEPHNSLPTDGLSPAGLSLPQNQNCSAVTSMVDPVTESGLLADKAGPSSVQLSGYEALDDHNCSFVTNMVDPGSTSGWSLTKMGLSSARPSAGDVVMDESDDITHLLAAFTEESTLLSTQNNNYEPGNCGGNNEPVHYLDGSDPFNGLQDLGNWAELSGSGVDFSGAQVGCTMNNMLPQDDMAFLELDDLDTPLNFPVVSSGTEQITTGSFYAFCNANGSQPNMLPGVSSTQCNSSGDFGQFCYNGNSSVPQPNFPGLKQLPMLPNSSDRAVDSTNIFQTVNGSGSFFSQGYNPTYSLHPTTHREPEEIIRDAAGNQERGRSRIISDDNSGHWNKP